MGRRSLLITVAALLAAVGVVLAVVGLVGSSGPPAPAASPAPASASDSDSDSDSAEVPGPSPSAPSARETVQRPASGSPPVALDVPSIGVSGPVNSVGLKTDRTLEVPQPGPQYDQAAWYRGSPTPGRVGPSVIVGHVDSAASGPSVFYDLGRMRPGEPITVTLADRSTRTFVVDAVRVYAKDAFPQLEVYGDTAGPELRLITCGGDFDTVAGSYRDNTVVFARLAR